MFSEIYPTTFREVENSLPCVKGGGTACRDGGIVKTYSNNPSVSFADSSPYTEEPTAAAGLLNGKSLF